MTERVEKVATSAGMMETFIAVPDIPPRGAVILYMDVWGVREELRAIARGVAANDYLCLLPDLYYRQGRIRQQFVDEKGLMRSLHSLTEDEQERVRGPMRSLTDEMVMGDTRALLSFMDDTLRCIGAVGYCMGGRHALLAGGSFPGRIHVAACLHGSNLVNETASSPHVIGSTATGEIYCAFAEHDPFGSADVRARLQSQCASTGARLTSVVHPGAYHGYALPERDVYNQEATERDWAQIYAMLSHAEQK